MGILSVDQLLRGIQMKIWHKAETWQSTLCILCEPNPCNTATFIFTAALSFVGAALIKAAALGGGGGGEIFLLTADKHRRLCVACNHIMAL